MRYFSLFLLFCLMAAGPVFAAATAPLPTAAPGAAGGKNAPAPVGPVITSEAPYSVKGVKVDVQAENSVKARDKAFTTGGREAYLALARRLSGDEAYKGEDVPESALAKLIRSFEVETERASGTRYVATLTFHFKPQAVAAQLQKAGKDVNEDPYAHGGGTATAVTPEQPTAAIPQGPRIVLLPLVRLPSRSILWEEKTPWHRAWENLLSDMPRADIILPEGSMEDIGAISTAEALSGARPALQRMMNRTQASGAAVMVLMAADAEISPSLGTNIQIARFDAQGQMQGTATVTLAGNAQKRLMEWLQGGAGAALGAMEEISRKYAAQGTAPPPQAGVIPPGYSGTVTRALVNVPFASMDEWASRRLQLEQVPGIANLEVLRMNRNRAMVQFDFVGEQPALDAALGQRGMKITPAPEGDGSYILLMGNPATPHAAPQTAPQPNLQPVIYQSPSAIPAPPDSTPENGDKEEP